MSNKFDHPIRVLYDRLQVPPDSSIHHLPDGSLSYKVRTFTGREAVILGLGFGLPFVLAGILALIVGAL